MISALVEVVKNIRNAMVAKKKSKNSSLDSVASSQSSARGDVPGFIFSGVSAGIKGKRKKDLALIVSEVPAKAVACFTTNRLKAAPVLYGQRVMRKGILQAVVVNSGNANAVTGPQGLKHVEQTAQEAARLLKIDSDRVLVSSTGKIGVPLPVEKILQALPKAVAALEPQNLLEALRAIQTTDRTLKLHQVRGEYRGKPFHVTGLAKGAGMIEPNMATMLAYLLTDVDLPQGAMKKVFRRIVGDTFNSITVDGDQSTNDTALLLANGSSGLSLSPRAPGWKNWEDALFEVCDSLATQMILDGEGATKAVTIEVQGARNETSARRIAYAIGRSQLVKTAFFGEDPNWGRVFCALGYSGETFDPSRVDIFYGPVALVRRGLPVGSGQELKAHKVMKNQRFTVLVHLNQGKGSARILTSDLTYEYVKINAEYRT